MLCNCWVYENSWPCRGQLVNEAKLPTDGSYQVRSDAEFTLPT